MKKMIALLMALAMVLALCACGGGGTAPAGEAAASAAAEASESVAVASEINTAVESSETVEDNSMVDSIDFTYDDANVKYVGFEKANEGLIIAENADNALVFVFEFTNNQTKPAKFQDFFRAQFYQNGVELTDNPLYSDKGGEQYDLVKAFFSESFNGGVNKFGQIVIPKDESPITIMISPNGKPDNQYQMMEVDISSGEDNADTSTSETSSSGSPSTTTETDYMTIDGLYVDDSYKAKDDSTAKYLYVVYTVHTDNDNLKIDTKSMKLKINDSNTYDAVRDRNQTHYMRSCYASAYLEKIEIGTSRKVVEGFEVPEADLAPGRSITLEKSQVPGTDAIRLSTDDIVHCDSPKDVAKAADPEGYKQEKHDLKDADSDRKELVKENIVDYEFLANYENISQKLWFKSSSEYELTTVGLGAVTGTYKIKNGYVVLKNDSNGYKSYIPYVIEDGKFKLQILEGLNPMY